MFLTILQYLLALLLIVGIHEAGHLWFAKRFGMRVSRYVIGFPPLVFQALYGGTTYALGLLPLGGFVDIEGMAAPGEETQLEHPEAPWLFFNKPAWQRLLVMLGGIFFNLATAWGIFFVMMTSVGEPAMHYENLQACGIYASELGRTAGLCSGDRIIAVNGKSFTWLSQVATLPQGQETTYTVLRKGQTITCSISAQTAAQAHHKAQALWQVAVPCKVDAVEEGSLAQQAGLQAGDVLEEINGKAVLSWQACQKVIQEMAKERLLTLRYRRGKTLHTATITREAGQPIGIVLRPTLKRTRKPLGLAQASLVATKRLAYTLVAQARGLLALVRGRVSVLKSVRGPLGMVMLFTKSNSLSGFWERIALLSIVIAFMNMLPIPALDGGHAFLLVIEMLRRKRLSAQWAYRIQLIGLCILLPFMLLALSLDIWKLVHSAFLSGGAVGHMS